MASPFVILLCFVVSSAHCRKLERFNKAVHRVFAKFDYYILTSRKHGRASWPRCCGELEVFTRTCRYLQIGNVWARGKEGSQRIFGHVFPFQTVHLHPSRTETHVSFCAPLNSCRCTIVSP